MDARIWHQAYVGGVPVSLEYDHTTISEALTRAAKMFPNHTALNYMGRRISYAQLDRRVNQFARALQALGVGRGDKVAVCLPNIPQAIISNLAIMRLGAVSAQNNPLYTERELAYQLADSDAELIITLTLLVPRVKAIRQQSGIKEIVACHIHAYLPFPKRQLFPLVKKNMVRKIGREDGVHVFQDLIRRYSPGPLDDCSRWEETAALIYTGGTTGVAKGVMLSNAHLSCNVQQFSAWFPDLKPGGEKIIGNYPAFHTAGFAVVQNLMIWNAWEHIMIPRPEPKTNIELIRKYQPTFLPGAPTIFVGLLAEAEFRRMDLSSIKGFFSGAAPLAVDTLRDLSQLTGASICEVYGATEFGPFGTVSPWRGRVKPGTVGIPLPDTDVRIVDVDDDGKTLTAGEVGEIAFKGPQVMQGYYKKPQETQQVLRDGWYLTGDIGYLDEDGYLSIVDRKKDMIIAGGYNIYPIEIDNVLFEHPKIQEACTIGVPDPYRGETVKAFVVILKGETLTAEEVEVFCRKRLAVYKVPKTIEFVEELPKSAVGKILRRELRERELKKNRQADRLRDPRR
jgi:long-chain acyl-CoA synthetase